MADELADLFAQSEVTTSNGLDATKAPRLSQWKGLYNYEKYIIIKKSCRKNGAIRGPKVSPRTTINGN